MKKTLLVLICTFGAISMSHAQYRIQNNDTDTIGVTATVSLTGDHPVTLDLIRHLSRGDKPCLAVSFHRPMTPRHKLTVTYEPCMYDYQHTEDGTYTVYLRFRIPTAGKGYASSIDALYECDECTTTLQEPIIRH